MDQGSCKEVEVGHVADGEGLLESEIYLHVAGRKKQKGRSLPAPTYDTVSTIWINAARPSGCDCCISNLVFCGLQHGQLLLCMLPYLP